MNSRSYWDIKQKYDIYISLAVVHFGLLFSKISEYFLFNHSSKEMMDSSNNIIALVALLITVFLVFIFNYQKPLKKSKRLRKALLKNIVQSMIFGFYLSPVFLWFLFFIGRLP